MQELLKEEGRSIKDVLDGQQSGVDVNDIDADGTSLVGQDEVVKDHFVTKDVDNTVILTVAADFIRCLVGAVAVDGHIAEHIGDLNIEDDIITETTLGVLREHIFGSNQTLNLEQRRK